MENVTELNPAQRLVEEICRKTSLSERQVCLRAGISQSYLSRLKGGQIELTPGMEARIKKAFVNLFPDLRTGVPYYPVDFQLGLHSVTSGKLESTIDVIHPMNGLSDMWIANRSTAMSPLIEPGDIMALRDVPLDSVIYGRVYAIVTTNDNLVRIIRRSEREGYWRLIPSNTKDFDEQEICTADVSRVFIVESIARSINP